MKLAPADLAVRLQAAQRAVAAAGVARDEIESGMVRLRDRLAAIEADIACAAIDELSGEFRDGLANLGRAVDTANSWMAVSLGWRNFLKARGDTASLAMIEAISRLKTPEFAATRDETASAAADWAAKFSELMK
jgi:hypothetical protein